jgi:hypothetical protein
MRLTALVIALGLAAPVAWAQPVEEVRNAPADEPVADVGGGPLNSADGMTGDDYQEEDLSRGVGNRLNQQQCIALSRYLQQTQTTVEVQQNLKARGCI